MQPRYDPSKFPFFNGTWPLSNGTGEACATCSELTFILICPAFLTMSSAHRLLVSLLNGAVCERCNWWGQARLGLPFRPPLEPGVNAPEVRSSCSVRLPCMPHGRVSPFLLSRKQGLQLNSLLPLCAPSPPPLSPSAPRLPFTFNTGDSVAAELNFTGFTSAEVSFAAQLTSWWGSFVATGDPNARANQQFQLPAYTPQGRQLVVLNITSTVENTTELCGFWDTLGYFF
jgi:hypothetical protein